MAYMREVLVLGDLFFLFMIYYIDMGGECSITAFLFFTNYNFYK